MWHEAAGVGNLCAILVGLRHVAAGRPPPLGVWGMHACCVATSFLLRVPRRPSPRRPRVSATLRAAVAGRLALEAALLLGALAVPPLLAALLLALSGEAAGVRTTDAHRRRWRLWDGAAAASALLLPPCTPRGAAAGYLRAAALQLVPLAVVLRKRAHDDVRSHA
jgi:hypothetical protein